MPASNAPILTAQGLCLDYPDGTTALRNIDFSVESRQFIALLGANGSGKTSLIKVLSRILAPTSGQVTLLGKNLGSQSAAEIYQQIGVVMQNPDDQLFGATVAEDVAFGPRNLGLAEDEVARRVAQSLQAVGAGLLGDRPVHRLSFGQQKRVCLAGVLAMRARILILDEPTAGLDPVGEEQMINLLVSLNREQGLTIVLATHAVDVVPLCADRLFVLGHGQALASGTPEEVFRDSELLRRADLRLPYVAQPFAELCGCGGPRVERLPLTVAAAREQIARFLTAPVTAAVTEAAP